MFVVRGLHRLHELDAKPVVNICHYDSAAEYFSEGVLKSGLPSFFFSGGPRQGTEAGVFEQGLEMLRVDPSAVPTALTAMPKRTFILGVLLDLLARCALDDRFKPSGQKQFICDLFKAPCQWLEARQTVRGVCALHCVTRIGRLRCAKLPRTRLIAVVVQARQCFCATSSPRRR